MHPGVEGDRRLTMNGFLLVRKGGTAGTKKNPPSISSAGFFFITSLTITYFHTGCSTIIGAKSFHGPVRDGKGWDRLAMVIRHDLYEPLSKTRALNLEEVMFR